MHSLQASVIYTSAAQLLNAQSNDYYTRRHLAQETIAFGKLVVTYLKVEGTGNITSASY
jgi:hypothetical protein